MGSTLLLLLGLPVAGAVLLMIFRAGLAPGKARWIALVAAIAPLLVSLELLHQFRELPAPTAEVTAAAQPRFAMRQPWLVLNDSPVVAEGASKTFRLEFFLGLDGISVLLIVLTALLGVSCVLISWESIREREADFYALLLLLEAALFGAFCAFDLVLFYVFFEFTLVPLFFLIGIWGGKQRRYAAIKFFLFTLTGSLVTLVGLVALVLAASAGGVETPTSIPDIAAWIAANPLSAQQQTILFLLLATGFMVKVPVFPLHTWLPLAHVEAPTAGSVLLAGVLLKLGTYGFLRMCLPMFPTACLEVGLPLLGVLGVIGIVYGSLAALSQRDIKKLVAYSSVAHMGFCVLGLFALNTEGLSGAVLQMINHGLSTGALFLLVGMIYDRYHTRQMDELGGLAARLPILACIMVFISMSSIGLPGLNGFVGEFLSLAGMYARHPVYAVIGVTGVILGAWYLLTLLQHVFFGKLREPHSAEHGISDINLRELAAVVPICVLCLWIGVKPKPLLDLIEPDIKAVAAIYAAQPAEQQTAEREAAKLSVAANRSAIEVGN